MKPLLTPRFFFQLVALTCLSLHSACTPEPSAPLRVGINSWPGYEFIFLAQEKDFYRDAGVNVRLIEFTSLSDCRRAYERGQIDAIGTTVIDTLIALDQSTRSPQIVRICDYSNGADVILAQSRIAHGTGLRGARIGVEAASLGIYILARGLEKHGLTLADVTVVSTDQLSMEVDFRQGALDAIVTYPPTSIKLLRDTKAHALFSTAEISGEVIDVIAIEAAVNRERAGDVAKFLQAFDRAIVYAQTNPADAHKIMAAHEGITAAEFTEALTDGIKVLTPADQAIYFRPEGQLSKVIDASDRILRKSGQLKGPDRRAGIINPNFLSP